MKFQLHRLGPSTLRRSEWFPLASALSTLEPFGCFPQTPDGLVSGNVARMTQDGLLVSRSGRQASDWAAHDFVQVTHFDSKTWKATYRSERVDDEPTSDTPLYWAALKEIPTLLHWKMKPLAAVHGHAFSDEQSAKALQIPISRIETEFSTPADRQALMDLLTRYPYPQYQVYIRRNHGFFVLGQTLHEAVALAKKIMERWKALAPQPSLP